MHEHNGFCLMFDKGQKQSSMLFCDSSSYIIACPENIFCKNRMPSKLIFNGPL